MLGKMVMASTAVTLGACAAFAADDTALTQAPPGEPCQQVSDLVPLPEFIPGLGTLYVDPATLPAGPFLGYDRDGRLSATIYMTPLEALEPGTSYDGLGVGLHEVHSVDIYYNAGHPGVDKPHAHVVLFHDEGAKARLPAGTTGAGGSDDRRAGQLARRQPLGSGGGQVGRRRAHGAPVPALGPARWGARREHGSTPRNDGEVK